MATDQDNNVLAAADQTRRLLPHINSPEDLRKLPPDALPRVAEEIRSLIIETLAKNPGHFASSMGAVEIAIALHYTLDTPDDKIVWDVGHQAYAHKILTGRQKEFETMRTFGGISGFPTPSESIFDTFTAGHASNSISAALGMAVANRTTDGKEKLRTVAVIGDASISGGLAFEGLNNASNMKNNLLIILNDNEMSIDQAVGALHRYLSAMHTSGTYNRWRDRLYRICKNNGLISEEGRGRVMRFNNSLKALFSGGQNIFEGLNIRYFGPFDGHDITGLVKVINEIKDMEGPRILHLCTKKGKGYAPAENNPAIWHAPGKFSPNTGERNKSNKPDTKPKMKWQDVFGETLVSLAEKDDRIVGITAGMPSGTSISKMMKRFPERSFDVGISEGHGVTFAGGLAAAGKRPYVAIYSAFLQRAYDSIINDVAIQGLPVTFCIDRAGLVGEDGVTHHGVFDMSYLRVIPVMNVASPMDAETLRSLMATSLNQNGPLAIRYPRGNSDISEISGDIKEIALGKGRPITENDKAKVAVLSIGHSGQDAALAIAGLEKEGIPVSHYDMIWLKPLDTELLEAICDKYDYLVTVEDGCRDGGFGSAVAEWLEDHRKRNRLIRIGLPDRWIGHGTVPEIKAEAGIDSEAIVKAVKQLISEDS